MSETKALAVCWMGLCTTALTSAPKLEDKECRIGTSEAMGSGGGEENFGAQNFGDEAV